MKLERVEFEEFRSIARSAVDIEAGITTLVGINESGKSNVLFAIEKADKTKKLENYDVTRGSSRVYQPDASPALKLYFKVDQKESEDLKKIFGADDAVKISRIVLTKTGIGYDLNYPNIDYLKSSFAETAITAPDTAQVTQATGALAAVETSIADATKLKNAAPAEEKLAHESILKALQIELTTAKAAKKTAEEAFTVQEKQNQKAGESKIRKLVIDHIVANNLPRILFFDSVGINEFYLPGDGQVEIDQLIADPAKYRTIVNLLSLGNLTDLESLRAGDRRKNTLRNQSLKKASTRINKEVLRVHWPMKDVQFELSVEETNFLSIRLREDGDDATFVPEDRSRGLQWSMAFNIFFLSESTAGELRNSILLIDEPGVFLHIDAQKKLLEETLPQIVKGNNQVIYTTHLPYLIDPKYPERLRILDRKDSGGETIIGNKAWSEGRVGDIPEPVKTALGTKWTEWFGMDEKTIFVEGPSDQIILRSLLAKISGEQFNFVPTYGKKSMPSALAIAKLDDKNAQGIIDNDSSSEEIESLEDKMALVNITSGCLSNVESLSGESGVETVEDLIPEGIFRAAVADVYRHVFERTQLELKDSDIPVTYPRIKAVEKYISSKLKSPDHNFRKMDVARRVADIAANEASVSTTHSSWNGIKQTQKALASIFSEKRLTTPSAAVNPPVIPQQAKEVVFKDSSK